MANTESFPGIISILLCLVLFSYYLRRGWHRKKISTPTNWPVTGMMPALVRNIHRLHDFLTKALEENGGTFVFKGPWFANLDMVFTADPANIHHILTKNFPNYPKGPEFRKIFDIFGDSIITADSEPWEFHRRSIMSILYQASFRELLSENVWQKVEKGLFPVLDSSATRGSVTDLQDIFQRFNFDSISKLLLDHDPESLSIGLPNIPSVMAFDDIMEALLYRHLLPESFWKLQKWLGIGKEEKLSKAKEAFHQYINSCIETRKEKMNKTKDFQSSDCLSAFMEAYGGKCDASGDSKVALRDILLNMMLAGRDTTATALTWFFWLLSKNPSVEMRIREEIRNKFKIKEGKRLRFFNVEESRDLVYLHGALCEVLRLFPPVPLEIKTPANSDILPSGRDIDAGTKLILSFYSMGKMESIWGRDCLEFKPERWISERGEVKHEPSYKFPAFHAGPRSCVGKEMAFIQMKMVAATIIYNYNIHMVKGHPVAPSTSIIFQMKHGLLVRLSRRN